MEFAPPIDENGFYIIEEGLPYGPVSTVWLYQGNFFSAMQGGSFRLPKGNTLITDCDSAHILEVSNDGNLLWEYIHNESSTTAIARSEKYALDYFYDANNIVKIVDSIVNLIETKKASQNLSFTKAL